MTGMGKKEWWVQDHRFLQTFTTVVVWSADHECEVRFRYRGIARHVTVSAGEVGLLNTS